MSLSVREQVIAAFVARLGTVAAPNVTGSLTVYRALQAEIPETRLPAVVVHTGRSTSEQLSAAHVRNVLTLTVEGYLRGASDDDLDAQCADLSAAIQQVIEQDPTLGGVAVDTDATDADAAGADVAGVASVGGIVCAYSVEFWTRPGDPYTAAP